MNENKTNMYKRAIKLIMVLAAAVGIIACDSHEQTVKVAEEQTYRMRLQGGCGAFDASTRSAYTWAQGDVVYLRFRVGESWVGGKAVYDFDSDLWTVTADAALTPDKEMECRSVFLLRPVTVGDTQVTLSEQSVAYADEAASYLLQDGELTVTSYLIPCTGRIRFRGAAGQSFTVTGLSFLTAYDVAAGTFTASPGKFTSATLADGNSDYYYATFADAEQRQLTFATTDLAIGLRRSFGANVLRAGESGYITIPTMEAYEGWTLIDLNSSAEVTLPSLSGVTAASVRSKSARFTATVTHTGNTALTAVGFVMSRYPNPTLADTQIGAATATSFSGQVTDLLPQTTYYVRAYATNALGTTYSAQLAFTTLSEEEDKGTVGRDDFTPDTDLNDVQHTGADVDRGVWDTDEDWN